MFSSTKQLTFNMKSNLDQSNAFFAVTCRPCIAPFCSFLFI